MLGKLKHDLQQNLFKTRLSDFINLNHELVHLSKLINWNKIEEAFGKFYALNGRPSIPIRTIGGLLMLKELFDSSDERVVELWIENPYWQYFTGEDFFQEQQPFDPSEFVHFRKRIGESGLEFLLSQTVALHPGSEIEEEVQVDTTVMEKNVTYPTDSKLAKKVIDKCSKIAEKEGIEQRQSYKRVSKQLLRSSYFGHHPKRKKPAQKARKRLRTLGKRVLRELERKLSPSRLEHYKVLFEVYHKALTQERHTKDKVYSLHEPDVACIAKGKAHTPYEFGTKVAVVRGRKTGVITAIYTFPGNPNDGKTLHDALHQSQRIREQAGGNRPKLASTDRGFIGVKEVEGTQILKPKAQKEATPYLQQKARKRFRDRAAIEPAISHLKRNHALGLNFLKGAVGNALNALCAAIGYNLKRKLKHIKEELLLWLHFFICNLNPSKLSNSPIKNY